MTTDAKDIIEQALMAAEPKGVGPTKILVTPEGTQIKDLEALLERPLAHRGKAVLSRVESFIEYVNQFKGRCGGPSRLYVMKRSRELPTLEVVFDDRSPDQTAWGRFKAFFSVIKSRQLEAWMGSNMSVMRAAEFATMIHRMRKDVVDPDSAHLVEILRDIRGTANVQFNEAIDQHTGAKSSLYAEKVKLKGGSKEVDIPTGFAIAIPIYERQAKRVKVNCAISAEVVEGKVLFSYEMDQIDEIIETVVDQLVDDVAKETDLAAFYGSPAINP